METLEVDDGDGGEVGHCDGIGEVGDVDVVRGSEGNWTDAIVGAE